MPEIKFGLFTSFILFVWMIIEYTLLIPNFHEIGIYMGILSVLIIIPGIFFGIKERRDKSNFGYIRFKEAFKTGISITFIITVLTVLFTFVYYEYINPNYVNYLAAEAEKSLLQDNAGREEIAAALTIIRYQFSFNVQLIQQLLLILIGGTAITTIVSVLLKKNRRHKSTNNK